MSSTDLYLAAAAALALAAAPALAQPFYFSNQTVAAGLSFEHDFPTSTNIGQMSAGGSTADFNNDGWTDVFVLGGGSVPDALFINNGPGPDGQVSFTNRAAEWGVDLAHHSFAVTAGDYDNDGDIDLYVTSFGPGTGKPQPDSHILYRNDGDRFTNVAAAASVNILAPGVTDGTGAAFGDFDLDGNLDLAVTAWEENSGANKLFHNDGDGSFTDATASRLPDMTAVRGFVPGMVDMNGDRYPELLWVSDWNTSKYFVCNGPAPGVGITYSDKTLGVQDIWTAKGMGSAVGDLNQDGRLDWYISSIYFAAPVNGPGNLLLIQRPNGSFENIAKTSADNVIDGGWAWGVLMVDLDHDGWLDLVETNGWIRDLANVPSQMFHNLGDGLSYDEVAIQSGFDYDGQGRGLVNFDADNDGDEDIIIFTAGGQLAYFRNDLLTPGQPVPAGRAWLRVDLDTSKRDSLAPQGFGSALYATNNGVERLYMIDGGFNHCSSGEVGAHIGLGDAASIDALRIAWNDGSFTTLVDVPANQRLTVTAPFHPADLDDSGAVDAGDINRFVTWYLAGSLAADQDGSGSLDFFDVFRFLTDFANAP